MSVLICSTVIVTMLALAAVTWQNQRGVAFAILFGVGLVLSIAILFSRNEVPSQPARTRTQNPSGNPSPQEQTLATAPQPTLAMLQSTFPRESPSLGYLGSDACRECHPNNHASWYASYHRRMTQVATPEAVAADFDNVRVDAIGRDFKLQTREGVCWIDMYDPSLPLLELQRINVPIVMTTGSHHMQVYWYSAGERRTLGCLPIVYLLETKEWIPRLAAFLQPESKTADAEMGRWNLTCSKCHTTHRRERPRGDGAFDTAVAEFGISCEACHGPGREHIVFQRSAQPSSTTPDPIVNPVKLSHTASSQVCGQCHSVWSNIEDDVNKVAEQGHSYRPGDELTDTYQIWQTNTDAMHDFLAKKTLGNDDQAALSRVYYGDGMVRVSGREYNGMIDSACHQRGEMSCLSCHQMHQSKSDSRSSEDWANDQLKPKALSDDACLQCHAAENYSSSHTHHEVGSSGASCFNCHMPHTTYGLLKAIRNHTISSPDVGIDLQAKRPNACNLCHLDKTLEWTADHLADWYEIDKPTLDDDQTEIAASLLWILKGDAAQRALVSWSMGWSEAKLASGDDWQPPFLAKLLNDPYPAIRLITRRSLQSYPEHRHLKFDAMVRESERQTVVTEIGEQWQPKTTMSQSSLLIKDGQIKSNVVDRLLGERDNTYTHLAE